MFKFLAIWWRDGCCHFPNWCQIYCKLRLHICQYWYFGGEILNSKKDNEMRSLLCFFDLPLSICCTSPVWHNPWPWRWFNILGAFARIERPSGWGLGRGQRRARRWNGFKNTFNFKQTFHFVAKIAKTCEFYIRNKFLLRYLKVLK